MSWSGSLGGDLDRWLAPFLEVMGRSTRSHRAPLYVRGLLGPDGPKSVQPLATWLGLRGHDQLHHFITSAAWDDAPLWRVLAGQADRLAGGPEAMLVIDDTALPKKGRASAGVAVQYCGALGKKANCQSLVSLTLARREVPVPVGLRLFLPDAWTNDPARCAKAGVPENARSARTKPEIALAEIDRLRAADVRFGCVLADAGYGSGAPFRQALSQRGLLWAVGVARTQQVFRHDVALLFPQAATLLRAALSSLAAGPPPDAEELAKVATDKEIEKFDGFLGDELLTLAWARERLDAACLPGLAAALLNSWSAHATAEN